MSSLGYVYLLTWLFIKSNFFCYIGGIPIMSITYKTIPLQVLILNTNKLVQTRTIVDILSMIIVLRVRLSIQAIKNSRIGVMSKFFCFPLCNICWSLFTWMSIKIVYRYFTFFCSLTLLMLLWFRIHPPLLIAVRGYRNTLCPPHFLAV